MTVLLFEIWNGDQTDVGRYEPARQSLLHRPEAAVERVRRHDRRRAGTWVSLAAGADAAAVVSVTDGFSAGLAAACLVSALLVSALLVSALFSLSLGRHADDRLRFGFRHLRLRSRRRRRRAGHRCCIGAAANPDLAGEAGEESSDCAFGAAEATRVAGADDVVETATTGSSGCDKLGIFGGLTVEGMVPGARDIASSDRLWPSPPSTARYCRQEPGPRTPCSCRRRRGIEARHRVPFEISLAVSAASCCCRSCTASAISSGIT